MFCSGLKVGSFGLVLHLSPHITGCRFDWWEDVIEYLAHVTGDF